MKIVYMGTPEFAVLPLDALITGGYDVVGVVTVPDKPAGRGRHVQASAVKEYALAKGLPLAQPTDLRDNSFLQQLHGWNGDVFVVVAFRVLPEEVFSIPPRGAFNLHASLLPQYRGAAPINNVIMDGEKNTGVTTFFIDKQIDTGQLIFQNSTPVADDENAGQLHDRLMNMGATLVIKTIDAIATGTVNAIPQMPPHDGILKNAPKITSKTRQIDWLNPVESIYNRIRGLAPYPSAKTRLQHIETDNIISLKILEAQREHVLHGFPVGRLIIENKHILKVACMDGFITINRLQPESRHIMTTKEFLTGFRDIEQYRLT